MRSIDVGYAARVSLDKAQKGYKALRPKKHFACLMTGAWLTRLKKHLNIIFLLSLSPFCPFRPFRLFGPFAVFAAIAYFEMNNYLCKIEYYGRGTVVYFNVNK